MGVASYVVYGYARSLRGASFKQGEVILVPLGLREESLPIPPKHVLL